MPDQASTQLEQIFADEWEFRLRVDPTFATMAGDHRFNDRLPGVKEEDFSRRAAAVTGFLDRLKAIERDALSQIDRLNYDFFARELQIQRDDLASGARY